jgi:membrane-bound serine protease (ClpP class)
VVEILPVSGFLDPPVAAQLRDVLEQAEREGSDLVVVQLDSDGGRVRRPRRAARP